MGEDNELEMDLFDSNIELNFDLTPPVEDEESQLSEEEIAAQAAEENSNPSENDLNDDSEDVAEDEESSEEGDDTDDKSSPNLYKSVATLLNEQGLFPSLDIENEKLETAEDFVDSFKKEIDSKVKETLISKIGVEGYEAIEKGISLKEINQYEQEQASLDSIKEEDIQGSTDLAKQIVYQDYINQGLKEETALRLLSRLVESGDEVLIKDATESLDNIKQYSEKQFKAKQEAANEQILRQEKERELLNKKIKDSVYNTEFIIKGQEVNQTMKDKVFKTMTEVVGKDENGKPENALMKQRRENPVDFDTKLYYIYNLTKGFEDFSKLVTNAKSTAVKDLEKVIRTNSFTSQTTDTPDWLTDNDSYDSVPGDELNI